MNEAVKLSEHVYTEGFITKEQEGQLAGIEYLDEAEIFDGDKNKITLSQTYSKIFHCTYLLHNFPFDTQVNNFNIILSKYQLISFRSATSTWF